MKSKLLLFTFILISLSALGQNSNITATVTDPDGTAWAGGTYSISFVPNQGFAGPYMNNGVAINTQQVYTGTLDGTGTFTATIPDSGKTSPSGTKWSFSIKPNASAGSASLVIPVTGATPILTTQISAVAIAPRFTPGPSAYGYADIEAILPTQPGAYYYNVSSTSARQWNGTAWVNWAGSGGGGAGIASINSDTTPAQHIVGANGITAATATGTTTIGAPTNAVLANTPLVTGDVEIGVGPNLIDDAGFTAANVALIPGLMVAPTIAGPLIVQYPIVSPPTANGIGGTALGDIIYCSSVSSGNCSNWSVLTGNTGSIKVLQESATGVPSWVVPSGGTGGGGPLWFGPKANLGVGQGNVTTGGAGGCSLVGSYTSTGAPVFYGLLGSATLRQTCKPQFTLNGTNGATTTTTMYYADTMSLAYNLNAPLTFRIKAFHPSATSGADVFSLTYTCTSATATPTFSTAQAFPSVNVNGTAGGSQAGQNEEQVELVLTPGAGLPACNPSDTIQIGLSLLSTTASDNPVVMFFGGHP